MASDTMTAGSLDGMNDGDRLPWLEAVEDEDDKQGPSAAKLIGALLVGLAAIAAIIFATFQLGFNNAAPDGGSEIIAADQGSYKERPDAAGGLAIEGEGDTAYAASEGSDPNARIDLGAIPEAPVAGAQGVAPAEQLKVRADAKAAQAVPNPTLPAVVPAVQPAIVAGGAAVQLGAFSSNASAQSAWKSMSGRFASLKPLTNSVVAASVGGKTMYRLRANVASKADAATLCAKLKIAGETCAVV